MSLLHIISDQGEKIGSRDTLFISYEDIVS